MATALRTLLVVSAAGIGSANPPPWLATGSQGCKLPRAKWRPGAHEFKLNIRGKARNAVFFLPTTYRHGARTPLWIMAPGAFESAWKFLHVSRLGTFAEKRGFAFAVLEGAQIAGMNVFSGARGKADLPDDVEYTRAVVREVAKGGCFNMDRIRCTGYSRGARFCSRLASELSSVVKGIAPVAGVRFPTPNNGTWPMPVIAFHGTKDMINPFGGNGDPTYWHTSVPDAISAWAKFNRCKYSRSVRFAEHILLNEHYDCHLDASVVLVTIEGGGHTWPGSSFRSFPTFHFGGVTQEIDANHLMMEFFLKHPGRKDCRTAREGEQCYNFVRLAMAEGLDKHPEWAGSLSPSSSFEDYQGFFHEEILADCSKPCRSPLVNLV